MPLQSNYHLRQGQRVWVAEPGQIHATLDAQGQREGLPFMPEMLAFCGRPFVVSHRVTKTCVEGSGLRAMAGTVFLEDLRCDGAAHDGCQRGCRLFWKECWLRDAPSEGAPCASGEGLQTLPTRVGERYVCQSTELLRATAPLPPHRLLVYLNDVREGEMSIAQFTTQAAHGVVSRSRRLLGLAVDPQPRGPRRSTEAVSLSLSPGEWVEVKSRAEIEHTLDAQGKNRGLLFCPSMLPYCGRRYRVSCRIERMIHEESGRMVLLQDTVLLRDVVCAPPTCTRANRLYWREAWLRRVSAPARASARVEAGRGADAERRTDGAVSP